MAEFSTATREWFEGAIPAPPGCPQGAGGAQAARGNTPLGLFTPIALAARPTPPTPVTGPAGAVLASAWMPLAELALRCAAPS